MRKISLFLIALFISVLSFGQAVEIIHETFGPGGFWEGPMNTNPNVTSAAVFSADKMRFQDWNASGQTYPNASKGYHGIMLNTVSTDTLRFSVNTTGFNNIVFSMGVFTWGGALGQIDYAYSADGTTWTKFNETAITAGNLSGGGWTYVTFSEILPQAEQLSIKAYRTAAQVHFDDLVLMGEPTNENAFLKTLSPASGTLKFSYFKYNYTVSLPYGATTAPTLTTVPFDDGATVVVVDATDILSAVEAERTSTVTVTSEDGLTENIYTIVFNVTPPRTNANLNNINLSYATLAPSFAAATTRYLVDLPDTATVVPVITPVLSDAAGASFELTPVANLTSPDVADRTATIVVTAQDGIATKTYEVVFKVGGGSTDLFLIGKETFGTAGAVFGAKLNTFASLTSNFIWGDQLVQIRASNPSTGYESASGGNKIEMQAGWAATGYDTIVFQANTVANGNVKLATGIYNNSGHANGAGIALRAYYSTDSINWTSIINATITGPASNTWGWVLLDEVLPTDDTLYIMFANQNANFEYWLDDITLFGTPLNTNNQLIGLEVTGGTLSPEFAPNTLSYTVDLPQGTAATPVVNPVKLSQSAVITQTDATNVRSLTAADRTTSITVTAENGSSRTYNIVFNVFKSSDATLKEVSVGNLSLAPNFDNNIGGYAVKLPAGTTEAPAIIAVPEDDFATVTITGPADIMSSVEADRTAYIEVVAEDEVNSKSFEIIFTFGSLGDVRFNFMQEMFNVVVNNVQAEAYTGYTSDATFDGDAHRWDAQNSSSYVLASGGAAIKFGEWGANPTFTQLVMKKKVDGYNDLRLGFGIAHNSGGWGDGGCGLTNNFIQIEYTIDSVNWVILDRDSLTAESSPWPCGGATFNFVVLGEEIPVDDEGFVTIRISHTTAIEHPFYIDDIVLSGSPISTDASLNDLSSSTGSLSPLFDPFVYNYTVELPIGTTATPVVSASLADETATVFVADATDVNSENEVDRSTIVTVTAADGITTKSYFVVFSVLPNNDPTLSSLSAAVGTLSPEFSPIVFEYAIELPVGSTTIPEVTAVANDFNASVEVTDGTDITSSDEADRTSIIVVTAEDGVSTLTYSILFTRDVTGINNADLKTLNVYPNPASDILYIRNAERINKIVVTSIIGNVIDINTELVSGRNSLNVAGLPSGMYIISVTTVDGKILTSRFVKK